MVGTTRARRLAWTLVAAVAAGCGGAPPAPRPPAALDDLIAVGYETATNFDVLANDTDPEGKPLTVTVTSYPADGTLVEESDGSFTYTPPALFSGYQQFTYTVTDSQGLTDSATATLLVNMTISLAISEAKGLFKPNLQGIGEYQAAYLSEDDNLGRVYSNRVYDAGDPSLTVWTANRQYVDFTVTVDTGGLALPPETRVVWVLVDPDDPSNEDAHAEAGDTLDPNDYDAYDNDGDGTKNNSDGNDNTGSLDGCDPWEELDSAYALSEGNATAISTGLSRVRFNATDDGGDNFILTAGVRLSAKGELVDPKSTGLITVWKRIDVEYVKMASATALDGLVNGPANAAFAAAFVEIVPENLAARDVLDVVVDSKLQMGVNEYSAVTACDAYVTSDEEFKHEGEPGWFFVAAANHFVDAGAAEPATLYNNITLVTGALDMALLPGMSLTDSDRIIHASKTLSLDPVGDYRVMQIDATIGQADLYKDGTVLYNYNVATDEYESSAPIISNTATNEVTYGATEDAFDTPIILYKLVVSAVYSFAPPDYTDYAIFSYDSFSLRQDPSGTYDKLISVQYKGYSTPTSYDCMKFNLNQYGFPYSSVPGTIVLGAGALVVQGISPGPNGGLEGRTIVFTAAGGDLGTLVHEFGHALGFHHICGNWDYQSDDDTGYCCTMHYSSLHFMLDHSNPRRPMLWTYGNDGPFFCEEHAAAIRKQNLEDLPALNW